MRNVVVGMRPVAGAISLILVFATDLFAQLPNTRLSAIFPTGGRVGTSVSVTITSGSDLEEITALQFDHPGIVATPKMQDVGGKPTPVQHAFTVTIAGDVPVGQYEVRAIGFFGISNPRFFVVGSQPEGIEAEPNNAREQANVLEVNQNLNGRIAPGADVDWFKFSGKTNQRMIVSCTAKRLDSRLDAALELYNSAGKRLEFARRNLSGQDPFLDFTVPADGDYFVKLYDFTFAGGEEYPYRVSVSSAPHIDFVLPASGIPDSNAQYTIYGRNLPGGKPAGISSHSRPLEKLTVNIALPAVGDLLDPKVSLDPFSAGIDAIPYSVDSPNGPSNLVMIQLGKFVPVLEVEPNDKGAQAQKVIVPIEVDGQFQQRNDVDCFEFEAKAKEALWVEVIAHRTGASIDPVVIIDQVKTAENGEQTLTRISAQDDDANNPLANLFDTLNDDNTVKFTAPADGTYRITLRERYGNVKDDLSVYRLIIRKESPDFRVVAVPTTLTPPGTRQAAPSEINLRRGDNFPVHVMAFRRDGFAGPIEVSAEGLPPGVTCREITIGTAPPSGMLVFTSSDDAPSWSGTIRLIAKAKIDDPAAVEAVNAARGVVKAAADALAAVDKSLAKPNEDLGKANEAMVAAKTELSQKPDDAAVKQKVAEAEAKVAAAVAAVKPLTEARLTAEQKLNDANGGLQRAEAAMKSAVRDVSHVARYGTVVWGAPQPNIGATARVAQSIELSVIPEASPFQLATDVYRVIAHHNRQILIPVKVARRSGFDQPVTITFGGQPANAQVENKPIPKEKSEETFRLFIPPNSPAGNYVVYLTGQAPVSYRKNPAKADKAKAEFDAADKAAAAAAEELKVAMANKDAAIKKATDDAANLKKLADAKEQAQKVLTEAQNAEKVATESVKSAGDNADEKAAAEKKLADAQAATKAAADALAAAEKARVDGEAVLKQAEEAKPKTEAAVKAAEEKNKAAAAEKAATEQRFKAADTYAKAANINFHPTTTPIVVTVKAAPYTLAATVADGGALKIGGKVEVKCEIKRQNGFAGPVTLSLPLPPSVTGLKAEPVTIAPDQTTGTLVIEAAADAPEAQLANMVISAASQFDGEAIVDQPIAIKTVK